jgi:hypothetical protein
MKEMPQFIQFHFPDFFPDFRLRQCLGCLAHPPIDADVGNAKQLSKPSETGLAEAVEQNCQSLGSLRATALWSGREVIAATLAAVALKSSHNAVPDKRGAATSLARKFHGATSWMVSGGIIS